MKTNCWILFGLLGLTVASHATPTVSNVHASQRDGSNLVDLYYDLSNVEEVATVSVELSSDGGTSYVWLSESLSGDIGGVDNGTRRHVVWDPETIEMDPDMGVDPDMGMGSGIDYMEVFNDRMRFRITATEISPFLYSLSGNLATIDRCTYQISGSLSIPSMIDGYTVVGIGRQAFFGQTGMVEVSIPTGVASIGERAFDACWSLRGITIPNSLTSMGEGVFRGCESLQRVTIPGSLLRIPPYTFQGCSSLSDVAIENGVTHIGNAAFWVCSKLDGIYIPSSVTHIDSPFLACEDLDNISVSSANPNFCSVNGILFNKSRTMLVRYPEDKSGSSYSIPSTVTAIDDFAFQLCGRLSSVYVPDSVRNIGFAAFTGCEFESITIPAGCSIGEYAFPRDCEVIIRGE